MIYGDFELSLLWGDKGGFWLERKESAIIKQGVIRAYKSEVKRATRIIRMNLEERQR
jgi:hypothetical protein